MKLVGNNRAIRSPEFHKRKQREKVLLGILSTLIFALVFIAPFFVLRMPKLLVSSLTIEGNGATRSEDIEEIVLENISGKLLWFVPKSNALLIPKGRIEDDLLMRIPRLSRAAVDLDGFNTLNIKVTERTPFALYCGEVVDVANPKKCFFLDESGHIFSEAPDFSGEVYMIYSASPILEAPLRTQLIEPEEFKNINSFISELRNSGIDSKAVIKRGGEYAALINGGAEIKWRSGQNLSELASDLKDFLRDSKMKTTAFGDLLYIDLRFDNKIYWLPNNE